MIKVKKGQDPYSVIGQYIRDHVSAIEDMIAVIEIDGKTSNELFMVDMTVDGYFIWNSDWYEGGENVVLIDFFPVSDACNPKDHWIPCNMVRDTAPSAQPEEIALHEFCTDCPLYDKDGHSCPRFNKVIPEVLREVQSEQRWTPVTERLPEDKQPVIFSTKTGRVHQGKYYKDGSVNQWYSALDKMRAFNNVVNAWMPLPEPYEERRQK